jgi:DNA modification methylase
MINTSARIMNPLPATNLELSRVDDTVMTDPPLAIVFNFTGVSSDKSFVFIGSMIE